MTLLCRFLFSFLVAATAAATDRSCPVRIGQFTLDDAFPGYIWLGDTVVTGGDHYPLPLIIRNLGIDEDELDAMEEQPVLLVGEGFSDLLPFLLGQSVGVKAIDPAYHLPEYPTNESGAALASYVAELGAHLIQGSAYQMEIPDGSQFRVFSHLLVNNLPSEEDARKVTAEMLRVLKPGGQASIFGYVGKVSSMAQGFREQGYKVTQTGYSVTTRRGTRPFFGLRFVKPE